MSDEEAKPPFQTAAEVAGFKPRETVPTPGLSQSPGLRAVPESKVPGLAGGGMISHVVGPQQNPADPIAAGLDTQHDPMTRAENRVVTQTGELGAGPRPTTYAGHGYVKQAADPDGSNQPPPAEAEVAPPAHMPDAKMESAATAIPPTELKPIVSTQPSAKPDGAPEAPKAAA